MLLNENLFYRVFESQTINEGLLPISPVTTKFLAKFESKQVMSLLWDVLIFIVFLDLFKTIPHAAVWYTTYPFALYLKLLLVS